MVSTQKNMFHGGDDNKFYNPIKETIHSFECYSCHDGGGMMQQEFKSWKSPYTIVSSNLQMIVVNCK